MMKLDYQINDIINNYKSEDGYKYNHVNWQVWISNQELLDLVNNKFNISLNLNTFEEVNKELAHIIHNYCFSFKKYIGTYGSKYLNDIF